MFWTIVGSFIVFGMPLGTYILTAASGYNEDGFCVDPTRGCEAGTYIVNWETAKSVANSTFYAVTISQGLFTALLYFYWHGVAKRLAALWVE